MADVVAFFPAMKAAAKSVAPMIPLVLSCGPASGTLAQKLQVLCLTRPIAARGVEELIDRLLLKPE